MGTTTVYRFRKFTLMPDPMGLPTFQTTCVSGDEVECGAQSEVEYSADRRDKWIQEHYKDTKHTRYQHTVADYRVIEPGEWL